MAINIEMSMKNSTGTYDSLYPKTLPSLIGNGVLPIQNGGTGVKYIEDLRDSIFQIQTETITPTKIELYKGNSNFLKNFSANVRINNTLIHFSDSQTNDLALIETKVSFYVSSYTVTTNTVYKILISGYNTIMPYNRGIAIDTSMINILSFSFTNTLEIFFTCIETQFIGLNTTALNLCFSLI